MTNTDKKNFNATIGNTMLAVVRIKITNAQSKN